MKGKQAKIVKLALVCAICIGVIWGLVELIEYLSV